MDARYFGGYKRHHEVFSVQGPEIDWHFFHNGDLLTGCNGFTLERLPQIAVRVI
jgi:hypothetical protein